MARLSATSAGRRGALRRGLTLASAVASFCVEGVGPAKLKAVQRADVMMRVEALRTLTHAGG